MILKLALVWHGIALYANNQGDVFSLTRHGLKLKKMNVNGLGHYAKKYYSKHYAKIFVQSGPYIKNYYVHILVCTAFHGPRPFLKAEVDHIDRDRWNNRPGNLHWVTHKENCRNRGK